MTATGSSPAPGSLSTLPLWVKIGLSIADLFALVVAIHYAYEFGTDGFGLILPLIGLMVAALHVIWMYRRDPSFGLFAIAGFLVSVIIEMSTDVNAITVVLISVLAWALFQIVAPEMGVLVSARFRAWDSRWTALGTPRKVRTIGRILAVGLFAIVSLILFQ